MCVVPDAHVVLEWDSSFTGTERGRTMSSLGRRSSMAGHQIRQELMTIVYVTDFHNLFLEVRRLFSVLL